MRRACRGEYLSRSISLKKILWTLLALTLLIPVATAEQAVTVKIFPLKNDLTDGLTAAGLAYTKLHPNVTISVENGQGADYTASLKAKFASGDEPDIFNFQGETERQTFLEKLEDLSNVPMLKNVVKGVDTSGAVDGGKIYGLPQNIEGYGFIYNKDQFKKAGITSLPTTLAELEAACKKLQAIGVTPFTNAYGEWWVLGVHNFNIVLANQANPKQFVADLAAGKAKLVGNDVARRYLDLIDLTIKYGPKSGTLTVNYAGALTELATGKAAMNQQGQWAQSTIDPITPNMNLGFLPMPVTAKSTKLYAGVPGFWAVNKNSPAKEAAKDFLNWLYTNKDAGSYIVAQMKFIPPVTNITTQGTSALNNALSEYSSRGEVLGWPMMSLPEGATTLIAPDLQAYIGGKVTKDALLAKLEKDCLKK